MDYSWQNLGPRYDLDFDPFSEDWGNNQDFQEGTISEIVSRKREGEIPDQPEQASARAVLRSGKAMGDSNMEADRKEDELEKKDDVEVASLEPMP
ncbi:hypothetical protein Q3G72_027235 [Acer saccharum]|nr:hypothetical protein Q3G72_027235 [Acer saccharum]